MNNSQETLYLSLMKKTLSFSLWSDPGVSILHYRMQSWYKRLLVRIASSILGHFKLQIVPSVTDANATDGRVWPRYAHTMIGLNRLDNIQFCVESVIKNNIEGDLIETGVWRGGACIFMRAILAAYGIKDRCVFVADSFAGLPKPDIAKNPQDKDDKLYAQSYLAVSLEEVKANFSKYDLLDDQVVFLKGWFADTLPDAPVEKLAIMRLDGDMYGSTMDALVNLYPKLSIGGFCIIDDYYLETCKKAVDDFRAKWNIETPLIQVDWTGVYWQKSDELSNHINLNQNRASVSQ
jgi:O-methyltransferase